MKMKIASRDILFSNRCTGLREIKCCTRKSRVAPAEPTVCCPPERRCGAICRRVFGCCNCKRADTQQRTKNTRAKHSLTSVVPPPLSEVSGCWGIKTTIYPVEQNKSPFCVLLLFACKKLENYSSLLILIFLRTAYQI